MSDMKTWKPLIASEVGRALRRWLRKVVGLVPASSGEDPRPAVALELKLDFHYGIPYVPAGKRRVELAAEPGSHLITIPYVDPGESDLAYLIRQGKEYLALEAVCRVYRWEGQLWAAKFPAAGLQQLVSDPQGWEKECLGSLFKPRHLKHSSAAHFHLFHARTWSNDPNKPAVEFKVSKNSLKRDTADEARKKHPNVRSWKDDGGEKARSLIDERARDLIIVGNDLCVRVPEPCFILGWDRSQGDIQLSVGPAERSSPVFAPFDDDDGGAILRWGAGDLPGARMAAQMLVELAAGGQVRGNGVYDRIAELPSHKPPYSAIEVVHGASSVVSGPVDAIRSAARLCREIPDAGRRADFDFLAERASDPCFTLHAVAAAQIIASLADVPDVKGDRRRKWSTQSEEYRSASLRRMIIALCKVGLWGIERAGDAFWGQRALRLAAPTIGRVRVAEIISSYDLAKVSGELAIEHSDLNERGIGRHFIGAWLDDGAVSAVAIVANDCSVQEIIGINGHPPSPATVEWISEDLALCEANSFIAQDDEDALADF